jgi:hypothetical protein
MQLHKIVPWRPRQPSPRLKLFRNRRKSLGNANTKVAWSRFDETVSARTYGCVKSNLLTFKFVIITLKGFQTP